MFRYVLPLFLSFAFSFSANAQTFTDKRKTLRDPEFIPGDVVKLPLLLFNFDAYTFRDAPTYHAIDTLKLIVEFLQKHPRFSVEIRCHTDTRVSDQYCQKFSQRRAQAVTDTLIKLGIDPKRVIAKGYSDTQPLIPDLVIRAMKTKEEQENAHMINRRVDMKILKVDNRLRLTLADSVFLPGDIIPCPTVWWDPDHIGRIRNPDTLEPVLAFLKRHKQLVVEIGHHTTSFGSAPFNLKLSEGKARTITELLISRGADPKRLVYKGYGETQLLVSEEEVLKKKTRDEQWELDVKNLRTELRILSVDYRPPPSLDDTLVYIGDTIHLPFIAWDWNNFGRLEQAGKDSLQPLISYLKRNKHAVVEIRDHWGFGSLSFCKSVTDHQQGAFEQLFEDNGISPDRYRYVSLGNTQPRISLTDSVMLKKDNDKVNAQRMNCYTDVKVVRVDFGPLKTMRDTAFVIYDRIKCPSIDYTMREWEENTRATDSLKIITGFLISHPGLVVEVDSYTDSRGADAYNDTLSYKRAKSIMEYLVANGVPASRVSCKGWGEKRPVVLVNRVVLPSRKMVEAGTELTEELIKSFLPDKNDFEFLHQLNRRTELVVLRTGFGR